MIFLETERALLRRFTLADTELMVMMNGDPEVMRYLTGKPMPPKVMRDEVMPRLVGDYARFDGLGSFAGLDKASGDFIGWYMLRPPPEAAPGVVELGYRLPKRVWRMGYASELSRALVDKAFAEFEVKCVIAQAMAANTGSRAVLEKVGLRLVRTYFGEWPEYVEGAELGDVEYAITREEWEARL